MIGHRPVSWRFAIHFHRIMLRLLPLAARSRSALAAKHASVMHRMQSTAVPPPQQTPADEPTTHFGFKQVREQDKVKLVAEVFHNVAAKYDLMNDVMSAGIHRVWKEAFVQALNPQPGMKLLDVAGGTGDIAFRFLEGVQQAIAAAPILSYPASKTIPPAEVIVCDINASMLGVGKQRAIDRGLYPGSASPNVIKHSLEFVEGNAECLPIASDSQDAYTIAFGLRNVTNIDNALKDAYRVLKKGGRFMCLEFSHVENPLMRQVYDAYSFNVIPTMGQIVAQDSASYQYLVESIRKFPTQPQLVKRMEAAGFQMCTYENLTFGVVAIHSGFKL